MAAAQFKELLRTLHAVQDCVYGGAATRKHRNGIGRASGVNRPAESTLRKTIAAFIRALKEAMELGLSRVRCFHRPKQVKLAGYREPSYSDIAITHAVRYYDEIVGDYPDYSPESMEYEETEGLEDILLLWESNLGVLRMLPRIGHRQLESLGTKIESEHRAAARLRLPVQPNRLFTTPQSGLLQGVRWSNARFTACHRPAEHRDVRGRAIPPIFSSSFTASPRSHL
jgi:hypothetical protein